MQPTFTLHLEGGALAGMPFVIADWSFEDEPPNIIWVAEVDGEVVGNIPDKAIRVAVAEQERNGLPGWTPYERPLQRWSYGDVWQPYEPSATPVDPAMLRPEPASGGIYRFTWAQRMDPNAREPRHLKAVAS